VKIALVSPYDYAYPGGVVVHICHLYEQFTKMGHKVKIITPCSSSRDIPFSEDVIPIGKPIPIYRRGTVARVALSPLLSRKVKATLKEEQFELIHLHEPLCPILPLLVLDHSKSANVGTFHAYHSSDMGYMFGRFLLRRWFDKLHGRIAVSKPARDFVNGFFPASYDIIPNGIDLEQFSATVPPIEMFCDDKLNILFVGRYEKRKGLRHLLAAYKQVKEEVPNTRLIIVGPGNREHYEKLVNKVNLRDVVFAGYVSNEDLPSYYNSCHLFCAPATGEESFGIVLLEAMAAAKPIVASQIEGYASVLSHGVEGILVPPKDEQALAQALIRLLSDSSLRQEMGARGKQKVEEYSWQNIAQRLQQYYGRLLHGS
jgi:phosphatidylinositol alpha-mannosyltransferase